MWLARIEIVESNSPRIKLLKGKLTKIPFTGGSSRSEDNHAVACVMKTIDMGNTSRKGHSFLVFAVCERAQRAVQIKSETLKLQLCS
jgi:hypothetical protein